MSCFNTTLNNAKNQEISDLIDSQKTEIESLKIALDQANEEKDAAVMKNKQSWIQRRKEI